VRTAARRQDVSQTKEFGRESLFLHGQKPNNQSGVSWKTWKIGRTQGAAAISRRSEFTT
jgi:hypothetical protein